MTSSFMADLHIHSRHSRATSRDMSPESLWKWSQLKGITVIGTGDFTHPGWLAELKEKLVSESNGLFGLKAGFRNPEVPDSCRSNVHFMLTAEISCIYKKNGKTRKIHSIILAPDFGTADKINSALSAIGNLKSDGRPILGLDAKELLRIVMDASPDVMLIPAHAWTPHFSVFGAVSGFDSLEECFGELTTHIHAIETGLSSDPSMNRRISALDRITLVSNSDAHSPSRIGREANILNSDISYAGITGAIKTGVGFNGTIEFFPEEGKYHYDGHRACGVSMPPSDTIRHNYACPVCGRKVTIGVMHRVETLADREKSPALDKAPAFHSTVPLAEIIAETFSVGASSKKVNEAYLKLLAGLGSEFRILMYASPEDISNASTPRIGEAVLRMRTGRVNIAPGYDGEFGKVRIFGEDGLDT